MGPEELARYRLRRVLGRSDAGVFSGEVWEAEDSENGEHVALKILRVSDEELLGAQLQLVHDAEVLATVRHPNLAVVHDAGEAAGTSFVVMELVTGKPIVEAAREEGVSREDKVRWLHELALALAAIHEADVVHRDVKPANVLVRADRTACLVDLGVALDEGEGAPDARDDQAAWASVARAVLADDMPEHVKRAVERAASEDRVLRFPSMEELAAALEATPQPAPPPPPPEKSLVRGAITFVVALGILVGFFLGVRWLLS